MRAPGCGRGTERIEADCVASGRDAPPEFLLKLSVLCACGGRGTVRSAVEGDGFPEIAPPPGRSTRLLREAICVRPVLADAAETTGRDIARAGGAAAGRPALAPSLLVRVGVIDKLPCNCARSAAAGETRIEFLPMGNAPVMARCEAAVIPPGACRFA
jgi:hypothetical protein